MTSIDPLLSAVFRPLVRTETGERISTSEQGVELVKRLRQSLLKVIAPIVGEAAFEALFSRSLKKTKVAFLAPAKIESGGPAASEMTKFCESLKTQSATQIEEIVVSLLSSFTGLLSTFIGEALTWKLMRNTWPDVLPSEKPVGEKP